MGKAFVRDRVGGRARWEEVGEGVGRDAVNSGCGEGQNKGG